MYKLKDTDAETFIKKTVEMSENLSKVNYQFLKIGNKEYPVDIEGKTIYINDIDSTDLELNVPMFYTPEGFHFTNLSALVASPSSTSSMMKLQAISLQMIIRVL